MTSAHKKTGLGVVVLLLGAGLWIGTRPDGASGTDRLVTAPFALKAPVQSSLEAPVDIEIESTGNGTATVTLRFHRPAENVNVLAYGTEGAQVNEADKQPLSDRAVAAGAVETFTAGYAPNQAGGGLFAVHVTGLFDGTMQMARAASVRLGQGEEPQPSDPRFLAAPGAKIVIDSEGRRVHAMPAGN